MFVKIDNNVMIENTLLPCTFLVLNHLMNGILTPVNTHEPVRQIHTRICCRYRQNNSMSVS